MEAISLRILLLELINIPRERSIVLKNRLMGKGYMNPSNNFKSIPEGGRSASLLSNNRTNGGLIKLRGVQ